MTSAPPPTAALSVARSQPPKTDIQTLPLLRISLLNLCSSLSICGQSLFIPRFKIHNFHYYPPMPPTRIGIIGCGRISGQYLWSASQSPQLRVLACADLDLSIAQAKAAEFHVPTACA